MLAAVRGTGPALEAVLVLGEEERVCVQRGPYMDESCGMSHVWASGNGRRGTRKDGEQVGPTGRMAVLMVLGAAVRGEGGGTMCTATLTQSLAAAILPHDG